MKSLSSPSDELLSRGQATHPELERLLAHLKVMPAEGLEERVLTRLKAESAWLGRPAAWFKGWAPAAMAASVLGVFAGGALVAHQTAERTRYEPAAHAASLSARAPAPQSAAASVENRGGTVALRSMDTAAARRRPATQILAGRRRGRTASR